MRTALLVGLGIFFSISLPAQNGRQIFGARAAGLGNTTSLLSDGWAVFNNPGGLAEAKDTRALFGYQLYDRLEGLSTFGAGWIQPSAAGTFGLAAFHFGDDLYNESNLSLTAANTFGIASLGGRINYLQYNVDGFGRKGLMVVDFGGIATLTPLIKVGMYVTNLTQTRLSEFEDERIPTLMRAGVAFLPSSQVSLMAEVEKDILYRPVTKIGLEYTIVNQVHLRTGVQVTPFQGSFGLGYHGNRLGFDYAIQHTQNLGYLHQIGVALKIKNE
jgi:hypothetical protein